MKKALKNPENGIKTGDGNSPSFTQMQISQVKQPNPAVLLRFRHKSDTFFNGKIKMREPSEPKINRNNPNEWFIFWNHDVPQPLWHLYPRKRIRIKINDDINRLKGDMREAFAEERRLVWKYKLEKLNYNPFEAELRKLAEINSRKEVIRETIAANESLIQSAPELTFEQKRKLTPLVTACSLWVESRKERTTNGNSVSTYRVTATWLKKYFEEQGRQNDPINTVTRLDIATALLSAKRAKGWEPTTYNNEYDTLINLFNWLELEGYIDENPIRGKIQKIPVKKHKHKWYDKDIKQRVKNQLLKDNELLVYRVMQFTYFILIRSKSELMKLKAADIDRTLKRVRFSAELSKNGVEAFRDYPPEFEKVLEEMDFDRIPKNFYVFGRKGEPSEFKCHKDLFADRWRPVREALGLSDDYTIYGMKHTRIVHELMKKTDGYDISHMARHEDTKSTKEYQRDYDITLNNVYKPGDLTF